MLGVFFPRKSYLLWLIWDVLVLTQRLRIDMWYLITLLMFLLGTQYKGSNGANTYENKNIKSRRKVEHIQGWVTKTLFPLLQTGPEEMSSWGPSKYSSAPSSVGDASWGGPGGMDLPGPLSDAPGL